MKYLLIGFTVVFLFLAAIDTITAQNKDSVDGDRQALVDLYNATGGDNWKNNSGWMDGNPSNNWYGIEVDGNGRVVKIKLNGSGFAQDGVIGGNSLKGELPETIGNLTRLTYFNVKQNELQGKIPSSIGNMTNLVDLLLNGRVEDPERSKDQHPGKENGSGTADRSNNFTGAIPSTIGELKNLQFFEATGKNIDIEGLSGAIPGEIGELTQLIGLHLDYNSLTSLPNTLQNLKQLVHLGVSVNNLSGGIPVTVKELESLRYFRIGKNGIGGNIPDMSMLKDLRIFSSTYNELTGTIPSALVDGTLPRINIIALTNNNLQGEIPEFGDTNLAMFTVDANNLTGTIPKSVANATRLINFGVGRNNLEGELPDFSNAYQLRYIRARNNNFTGSIPALHTDNGSLRMLWLQGNNLSTFNLSNLVEAIKNGASNFDPLYLQDNSFCESDLIQLKEELDKLGKPELDFIYHGNSGTVCNGDDSGGNSSGDDDSRNSNIFPSAPVQYGPGHESENVSLTPEFAWSDIGADYYILHADRSTPGGLVLDVVIEDTTFTPSEIFGEDAIHYWRVRGVKDGEAGEWSPVQNFKTGQADIPEMPDIVSPALYSENVEITSVFEWEQVEADYFNFRMKERGSSDWSISETVNSSVYIPGKNLKPDTEYTWQVKSVKSGVAGAWTPMWKFTTGEFEYRVNAPALLTPGQGAEYENLVPTFEWEQVDADHYVIVVAREKHSNARKLSGTSDDDVVIYGETSETLYTPETPLDPESTYYWRIQAVRNGEESIWSEEWEFKTPKLITGMEGSDERATVTTLKQNYPNPFNPTTQIEYTLTDMQTVSLRVYDMAGRQVAVLVDGVKEAGRHMTTFSAENLASGIYFYRLITDSQAYTKKMTLVK